MNLKCPIMMLYNDYSSQSCEQDLHFHQNLRKSSFFLTFKGACRRQFQSRKIFYLIFFLFLGLIDQTHNKSALRIHKLPIQWISLCNPTVILLKGSHQYLVVYCCYWLVGVIQLQRFVLLQLQGFVHQDIKTPL